MSILSKLRRMIVDALLIPPVFVLWFIDEYTRTRKIGPKLARFGTFAIRLRGSDQD